MQRSYVHNYVEWIWKAPVAVHFEMAGRMSNLQQGHPVFWHTPNRKFRNTKMC